MVRECAINQCESRPMLYEALLACDEARYMGGDLSTAKLALRNVVEADPAAARAMLPRLAGCARTVERHRLLLLYALSAASQ
jgi:hypothetical protein